MRTIRGLAAATGVAFLAACGMSADDKQLPAKWAIDYDQKSIAQIIEVLGDPQEDGKDKQFLNWVEKRRTGTVLLKVVCPGKCDPDELPSDVQFYVYSAGAFKPLKVESLLKVKPADAASQPASAALPASDPSRPQ